MERFERTSHRVGVVVAVLLVAHLGMLQTAGHTSGPHAPAETVATSAPLPTAGGCPTGMAACVAWPPDDPAVVVVAAALVLLVGVIAPRRRRRCPRVHRVRRDHRHPPRPCVPAWVVLLQ